MTDGTCYDGCKMTDYSEQDGVEQIVRNRKVFHSKVPIEIAYACMYIGRYALNTEKLSFTSSQKSHC